MANDDQQGLKDSLGTREDERPLPVAVVAKTLVSTRPDTEIATRIGSEVPVIEAIVVRTSCVAISRMGTRLAIPPPSITDVLHESDIMIAKAVRDAARLRHGWRKKDRQADHKGYSRGVQT